VTALLAVGHGSRDPRAAETTRRLLSAVRALRRGLDVRESYLDLAEPDVPTALAALAADGVRDVVAVPLLLAAAYHSRVDLPEQLALAPPQLQVRAAEVLGPSPRLVSALLGRLAEAGAVPPRGRGGPRVGLVVAAAGSSDPAATAGVRALAAAQAGGGWAGSIAAFAASAEPDVATAVAELRAAGAQRVAVGRYFLAPGLLADRVAAAAPGCIVSEPLGAAREVAQLVLDRFDEPAGPAVPGARAGRAVSPAVPGAEGRP